MTVDSPTTSSIGGNHPLGLFPFQSTQSRRISPSTSPQLQHSVHDGKVKIEFLCIDIRINRLVGIFLFGIRFLCRVQTWTSEGYMVSWRYYNYFLSFRQKCVIRIYLIFFKVSSIDNCDSFSNGRNIGKWKIDELLVCIKFNKLFS